MGKRMVLGWVLAAVWTAGLGAEERATAVTVYNNDLGLVREVRRMDLKPGVSEVRFSGVAANIDPTSVHFKSLTAPDKAALLEQNYEYDLVSADKILSKYVDETVQISVKDGKMFEGRLLSAAGDVVLEKKDGSVQSLSRAQVQSVDFPKLPLGLVTKPTLVWTLRCDKPGPHDMEVSYLTSGISWHAEYVGVADPDDKKLELSAWVSIDNRSGASYENARLKLVAGDVNRAAAPQPLFRGKTMMRMAEAAADQFEEKPFFEYHLYTLARPATVKDNQIKQLSLFPAAAVTIKKIYKYDGSRDAKKVKVTLEFVNSKAEGLGMALPAGKVRIYKEDADKSQQFVGEDRLEHTAKDEKVRLTMGDAFDVVGERTQKDVKQLGSRARQETVEVRLRNHKDADVDVVVTEHFSMEWEILKTNFNFEKKDSGSAEFKIPVKKDGEAVLEYTAVTRW